MKFINFLYWFIHNEILTPIFILLLITSLLIIAIPYRIYSYFYNYYVRVNKF